MFQNLVANDNDNNIGINLFTSDKITTSKLNENPEKLMNINDLYRFQYQKQMFKLTNDVNDVKVENKILIEKIKSLKKDFKASLDKANQKHEAILKEQKENNESTKENKNLFIMLIFFATIALLFFRK
jgi:hypothetical protein